MSPEAQSAPPADKIIFTRACNGYEHAVLSWGAQGVSADGNLRAFIMRIR